MRIEIGIIGDYNPSLPYHPATNAALDRAASAAGLECRIAWVATEALSQGQASERLSGFDALFASPGSPYRSMEGALAGIRFARERNVPFTGT